MFSNTRFYHAQFVSKSYRDMCDKLDAMSLECDHRDMDDDETDPLGIHHEMDALDIYSHLTDMLNKIDKDVRLSFDQELFRRKRTPVVSLNMKTMTRSLIYHFQTNHKLYGLKK